MNCSRRTALLVLFLFLQPLWRMTLVAQVDRSAITGTVTDQQGSRVPQTRVRATQGATGFQRDTLTKSEGTYRLPDLPPGIYSIQFFHSGFSNLTVEQVKQIVGQTRTLNAHIGIIGKTGYIIISIGDLIFQGSSHSQFVG